MMDNLARVGRSKKNPTHAEEKRIPHLQSEAIPEAAWKWDYHDVSREQREPVNPKNQEIIQDWDRPQGNIGSRRKA